MTEEMKRELDKINATLSEFRGEFKKLHETDHRIAAALVRLDAKVDRIGEGLASALKKALEPVHAKLDSVARLAESRQ